MDATVLVQAGGELSRVLASPALVIVIAAGTALWSRDSARRARAWRLLRLFLPNIRRRPRD